MLRALDDFEDDATEDIDETTNAGRALRWYWVRRRDPLCTDYAMAAYMLAVSTAIRMDRFYRKAAIERARLIGMRRVERCDAYAAGCWNSNSR